jgi:hypothetical protein
VSYWSLNLKLEYIAAEANVDITFMNVQLLEHSSTTQICHTFAMAFANLNILNKNDELSQTFVSKNCSKHYMNRFYDYKWISD